MQFFRNFRDRLLTRMWYWQFKDTFHHRRITQIMSMTEAEKKARGITRTVRLHASFGGMWPRTIVSTPGGSCQWGKTLFVADGPCDLLFAVNSINKSAPGATIQPPSPLPPPERIWALHMEPEEYVKKLGYDDPADHALASRFYTCCDSLLAQGGRYIGAPTYVHNHLSKTWDQIERAKPMKKPLALGMIMSGLKNVAGHHTRHAFLDLLEKTDLDYGFWGRADESFYRYRGYRGFAPSKWNVHAQSRYSLVFENTVAPFYWSEKPVDALLAWSLPIYHGSPLLENYLPAESFIRIDLNQPEAALEIIRKTLRDDPYEKRLPAIAEARRILQHEQHLYAFIERELNAHFHG